MSKLVPAYIVNRAREQTELEFINWLKDKYAQVCNDRSPKDIEIPRKFTCWLEHIPKIAITYDIPLYWLCDTTVSIAPTWNQLHDHEFRR